jgi:hypothetical protein
LVTGTLFNGAALDGVNGLRRELVSRPEVFVGVMTEKLMTYALGRGVEYYDMPAVRKVVQDRYHTCHEKESVIPISMLEAGTVCATGMLLTDTGVFPISVRFW